MLRKEYRINAERWTRLGNEGNFFTMPPAPPAPVVIETPDEPSEAVALPEVETKEVSNPVIEEDVSIKTPATATTNETPVGPNSETIKET
jgi:hypothetical protein